MKKHHLRKIIFWVFISAIVIIQFFPAERNDGSPYGKTDYISSLQVNNEIKGLLENSCFDCHSNKTHAYWYDHIQPIGWWMSHHVTEGKEELNFSEFSTYKLKRKIHKLEEIAEQIEKDEMAPGYYVLIHSGTKLSDLQREKLVGWARSEAKRIANDN